MHDTARRSAGDNGVPANGNALHPTCYCCGRSAPDTRVDGGMMHFRCWDEHHSDPHTEWPVGHVCQHDSQEERP